MMETSCHVDGTLFPFDWQKCKVIIQSWAYSETYVDLRNASNVVQLDGFNDDRKLNASLNRHKFIDIINVSIKINRK